MNPKRFILSSIEAFLNAELHPATVHETLAEKPQLYWEQLFEVECRSAVQRLKDLRYQFSAADCRRHNQLVYMDAFGIIGLLKQFEKTQTAEVQHSSTHSLYTAVIPFVERVLRYIESTGEDCFESATLLPDYYLLIQEEVSRQQHLVLRAKLKSKDIDPELQQIVNNFLDDFLHNKPTSYRQLQYTRSLSEELSTLLRTNHSDNWTPRLMNKLVILNFNHPAFYEYCIRTIGTAMEQEQSLERKCAFLRWQAKELKNLLPKPGMALDTNMPSIRKLLLNYLATELDYLNLKPARLEAATTSAPEASLSATAAGEAEKLLLHTNIRQFTVVIHCLVHLGILQPEKGQLKGILQFFARHFSTIGAETLSVQSLQKRISEKNDAAVLAVITRLEAMISYLKGGLGA